MDAKTEVIALQYGRLVAELKEPGWEFLSCWGRELKVVSTADIAIDLPEVTVADHDGNPIDVSAVVTIRVVDAKRAVLNVENYQDFVELQALTVLRQVAAQYPYRSNDPAYPSLKDNAKTVQDQLAHTLGQLTTIAGVHVVSFRLDEITYSTDIAAVMLRKQTASAMLSARKLIVDSAVSIACEAADAMVRGGMALSAEQQGDLIVNLISTICAGRDVAPTLSLDARS